MATVCILEDDATMAGLLKMLLELEGHGVVIVSTQPGLPERVEQERPDILVMDVCLNGADGDGIDILRTLKARGQVDGMRVIMCSGLDMEGQCLAAGAHAFLQKPYDPSRLTDLVRSLCAPA